MWTKNTESVINRRIKKKILCDKWRDQCVNNVHVGSGNVVGKKIGKFYWLICEM